MKEQGLNKIAKYEYKKKVLNRKWKKEKRKGAKNE